MLGLFRKRDEETSKLAAGLRSAIQQLNNRIGELEAKRSQFEGILEGMTEGVLVEGYGGGLLLINPAAREILGIQGEVPPGTRSSDLVRHPVLREMIEQVRAGGARSRDLTLLSPVERHLRVHGDVCRSPSGTATLLVFHDITDLKRLENLRRDFVANVSHELKTPLTAIQGSVETLLGGALKDADRGRPFIESIAEETVRLRRLVDDLLALAQVESHQEDPKTERIELGPFLEGEILRHRPEAAASSVALNLETVPPHAALTADRRQFSQAIGNLLENAIRYNRPGGRVSVRVFTEPHACRIEVEDTGIGIPAEDQARIFERFYRVDKGRSRETGGTGLGLSIVKHVAEAHGGTVRVESRPGSGSRFTLTFPLA